MASGVVLEGSPGRVPAKTAVRGRSNSPQAAGRLSRARSELWTRPVGRGCSVLREPGKAGKNGRKVRQRKHQWRVRRSRASALWA